MPDPASITLSREGVSVTVKVGDVVPMVDGTRGRIIQVAYNTVLVAMDGRGAFWLDDDGAREHDTFIAIDLAALAAPARAAPAVPTERVLALAKEWRGHAVKLRGIADAGIGHLPAHDRERAACFDECAAALEALASSRRTAMADLEALAKRVETEDGGNTLDGTQRLVGLFWDAFKICRPDQMDIGQFGMFMNAGAYLDAADMLRPWPIYDVRSGAADDYWVGLRKDWPLVGGPAAKGHASGPHAEARARLAAALRAIKMEAGNG